MYAEICSNMTSIKYNPKTLALDAGDKLVAKVVSVVFDMRNQLSRLNIKTLNFILSLTLEHIIIYSNWEDSNRWVICTADFVCDVT